MALVGLIARDSSIGAGIAILGVGRMQAGHAVRQEPS